LLSQCNHLVIHTPDEAQLLHGICEALTVAGAYAMAAIGMRAHDGLVWTRHGPADIPTAAESPDLGQRELFESCINSGCTVVWRQSIAQTGFESSAALALRSERETIGVLVLDSVEPDAFPPSDVRLLEELAGELSFGIETRRREAERTRAAAIQRRSESE